MRFERVVHTSLCPRELTMSESILKAHVVISDRGLACFLEVSEFFHDVVDPAAEGASSLCHR